MYRPRQILVEEEETSKNQLLREEEKDITTRSSSTDEDDEALDSLYAYTTRFFLERNKLEKITVDS